jgi:hypothetical protein
MTESKIFQKIKINKISLNQSTSLSKNFYQDQYYLDVLINNKYSQQSSPIKINKFYESYDIDSETSFSEELDTIFFKF